MHLDFFTGEYAYTIIMWIISEQAECNQSVPLGLFSKMITIVQEYVSRQA